MVEREIQNWQILADKGGRPKAAETCSCRIRFSVALSRLVQIYGRCMMALGNSASSDLKLNANAGTKRFVGPQFDVTDIPLDKWVGKGRKILLVLSWLACTSAAEDRIHQALQGKSVQGVCR